MSVGNTSSSSPPPGMIDDSSERWSFGLGRIGDTRLSLSYSVFFAAAILVAVVLFATAQPNTNSQLPRAAALGSAFWISGWLMQVVCQLGTTRLLGLPIHVLNVGLVGVEGSARRWHPRSALLVAMATVVSLLLLGCFYRLVEGGFRMPVMSTAPEKPLAAPSIGFASHDSTWRSGAWLCWAQALFQLYPIPRTMGRQMIGALVRICSARLDMSAQIMVFRRCLSVLAMMTLLMAMFAMSAESGGLSAQWPLVLLLGVLLWASARAVDVTDILMGFESAELQSLVHPGETDTGWITRIRQAVRSRRDRRRLQEALDRERSEAVDAERLDGILNQLHQQGVDSLSDEDREILQRVSENLRKQRQNDENG